MYEINLLMEKAHEFYDIAKNYINENLELVILGVLVISIVVVILSIIYILVTPNSPTKKAKVQKPNNLKKDIKIKYTQEFLKGVKGIDLDLK